MLLELVLTNWEELIGDEKAGGSLRCSNYEIVEFRFLDGRNKTVSRITTLDFRRASFDLFKGLLGGIPWATELEVKGTQKCWLTFRRHFFQAQDQFIPKSKK